MEKQIEEVKAKAVALGKAGQKPRALMQLKHKKYLEKEITKIDNAEMMLAQTV